MGATHLWTSDISAQQVSPQSHFHRYHLRAILTAGYTGNTIKILVLGHNLVLKKSGNFKKHKIKSHQKNNGEKAGERNNGETTNFCHCMQHSVSSSWIIRLMDYGVCVGVTGVRCKSEFLHLGVLQTTSDCQPQFQRYTWLLPRKEGFYLTCKSNAHSCFPCFCHRM